MTLDLRECRSDETWIARLCASDQVVRDAFGQWRVDAADIGYLVHHRCRSPVSGQVRNSDDEVIVPVPIRFSMPPHFEELTQLLVAYCDRVHPHVSSEALLEFHDASKRLQRVDDDQTGHWLSVLEDSWRRCQAMLQRLEVRLRGAGTSDEVGIPTDFVATGKHEIEIDRNARQVRRRSEVACISSDTQWHIFLRVLSAAPAPAGLEVLASGYPGEFDARHVAATALRKKLVHLGLTITRWRLCSI